MNFIQRNSHWVLKIEDHFQAGEQLLSLQTDDRLPGH